MKPFYLFAALLTGMVPFACPAADDASPPEPVSWTLPVPAGKVLFVGFDNGAPNAIRLRGRHSPAEAGNRPIDGVDIVECLTATGKLTLKVSASWPLKPLEENSWGEFRVEAQWRDDRTEVRPDGTRMTRLSGAGTGTGYRWRLEGHREYAEQRDAQGNAQWQWRQTEDYHPMQLEKQQTGIPGLAYYRIACISTASGTKGLVIFLGDSIDLLAERICVSGRHKGFRWDRAHFPAYGKPLPEQGEPTTPLRAAP